MPTAKVLVNGQKITVDNSRFDVKFTRSVQQLDAGLSKAQKASTQLATAIDDQNDAVDAVLLSIDKELDWARNIMRSVDVKAQNINWDNLKSQFYQNTAVYN